MKANIVKRENNIVQLEIEIDAEVAAQEYNKSCRKISERIAIPGFRQGKAPRSMVEKYAGLERIQQEALDHLLPNVFADTISEHQLDIISEPIIESYNFELGEPLKVVARLELKPEVTISSYKSLQVDVPEFKHPDNAVEIELKSLAERFATSEPVINRPTNETDIVVIDYLGTIDGEAIKGGAAKNHQLDLANSNFIKGFAEQLIGKNIGEDFKISVTFPEDYYDADIAGKNAEFQIKINEIKEKIVPEINDELAQKVGPFQTLTELKADMETYLEKSRTIENESRAEKELLNKIVDQAQVEIPDSMINKEAKVLLEEVQTKFKSQGISWDQVLDAQGQENIWKNLREEASKRIKTSLVLGEIGKLEDIRISDEDFMEKVRELGSAYNTDEKTVFKQLSQNPGLAQGLSQQILGQKIIKFLLDNNEVKYIEDTSVNNEENSNEENEV